MEKISILSEYRIKETRNVKEGGKVITASMIDILNRWVARNGSVNRIKSRIINIFSFYNV